MKILIIDDHPLFSDGLKFLISDIEENVQIESLLTVEAIESIHKDFSPDLILLDYYLKDSTTGHEIESLNKQFPEANVVVISSEESPNIIMQSLSEGASGYIPKSANPELMVSALKLVMSGGTYVPNEANMYLHANKAQETKQKGLTKRQKEVLALAVKGKANKVIAMELGLAEGTVKAHLSAAFQVLKVSNRTEAAISVQAQSLICN